MIGIINYGMGNINAFTTVLRNIRVNYKVVSTKDELYDINKIILPGVGAFDHAMTLLNNSGMRKTMDEMVLDKAIPVLGVCVGMQILGKFSDEGKLPGLDWIEGVVKKFDEDKILNKTKLPHMGWNTVEAVNEDPLFVNLEQMPRFYFLHSYYFECCNRQNIVAQTDYGIRFDSAVRKDNIYGVQFHPEKSHHNGIQILKNFAFL